MAYGKDPRGLSAHGSFRQQSAAMQAMRPRPSGKSVPRFVNQFSPSFDYPDTIRIIRGNYNVDVVDRNGNLVQMNMAWFPYVDHFHGVLKRGGICSAGPFHNWKDKRQPCHGCDAFWAQRERGQKNGPMGKREMYAVTIMHFAPYAKVEQVDKNGQLRRNQQGEPYMEWVRVLPHERAKYQGREMREWNLMHWALGWGHWSVLDDFAKDIGRSCKACGGRDTIASMYWACRNCGEVIIDMSNTQLTPKQIDEMTVNPCRCPHCGFDELLEEQINCSNCGSGIRADLYDVDLQVQRHRANDGSSQTTLHVKGWSNPRPIDPRFAEFAKPLDLPAIYAPDSLERQAEMWGMAQAAPSPAAGQYRPYGQQAPQPAPQPGYAPPGYQQPAPGYPQQPPPGYAPPPVYPAAQPMPPQQPPVVVVPPGYPSPGYPPGYPPGGGDQGGGNQGGGIKY